ncbi:MULTISPECIES: ATP-binding protein [unclassified Pseudoalteromonas]|uniref:ATP-binding protein n=1 Tax=unclassified Pseudoalteromonas TaxID=194690 RepID=UPI000CC1AB10|nr:MULTISPECIES: ATP-binding protein [unclassified Pseudoalteromonas]MBH0016094.1 ATP-binding protein [Pseudoalteromonas sp. NGC95]MBH0045630.1 ATP-binding protein [Pseudoalteromonas sp. NZS11_1]PLT24080.1 two-component sensor histidine kinase [Pseudoalteromonas sp. MelDa3]
MGKLFTSLYLYIIVSLFVVSGVIEQLWPYEESQQQVFLDDEFGQSLWLLSQTSNGLKKLKHNFESKVIERRDLILPQKQQSQLNQNHYLYLYDKQQRIVWYVDLGNDSLLQVGPVGVLTQESSSVWPYLLLLIIVGIPVGLWSFLLWRDFAKLRKACEAVEGLQDFQLNDSSKSFFLPITDTLKVMQQRIEFLLSAQQELTSSVSHEFRTPLARLKFAIVMLQEQMLDVKGEKYLTNMQTDISELESLVSEMLEYARLDSQQPSLQPINCDLAGLVKTTVEKLNFEARTTLSVNLPEHLNYYCDSHFMARVFQNLIGNALKYTHKKVKISLLQETKHIVLIVEDDGEGIAPAERENVFKPFTRLDKSRGKDTGGFGLGLAIVAKIVSWHQGECKAESSSLGGAKFIVYLPLKFKT